MKRNQSIIHKLLHFITHQSKEYRLLWVLGMMFFVILMRLFWLEVVTSFKYESQLINQHFTTQDIKAKRGNIYITDDAGKSIQLTESVDLYTVSVDPKYIKYKDKVIEILTPFIYQHYCSLRGTAIPSKLECIQWLESFTQVDILPPTKHQFFIIKPEDSGTWLMYGWSDNGSTLTWVLESTAWLTGVTSFDEGEYAQYLIDKQTAIDVFSEDQALTLIKTRLNKIINTWVRPYNFVWFIENPELIAYINQNPISYLSVENNFYLYVNPSKVWDINTAAQQMQVLLSQYGLSFTTQKITALLSPQENRYVKIMDGVSSIIATTMITTKQEYQNNTWRSTKTVEDGTIPLLHGIWFEKTSKRYYPYGNFMSNILGFVDNNNKALYGIEEYFDTELAWHDGKINWLGTPWIGEVASNELDVEQAKDGSDITLTVNPTIQKEIESIIKWYNREFRSDSISVIVMNPWNGELIANASYPTFDPNSPNDVYQVKPLWPDQRYLVLDPTYVDVPMYLLSGSKMIPATSKQRFDLSLPKYIHKNINWPSVFIDKTIAYPYEPGSIFKPITASIGIDADEISLYDRYYDPGKLQIWPYEIKNVAKACLGSHDFLHALQFSCNVGMIRIIQRIRDYVFYNYLDKLWFGKLTGIELAGEDEWSIPDVSKVSRATFYNNSFGQGLTATPLQMAQAYSAIVNGWYLIKPTIIKKIGNKNTQIGQNKRVKIFKDIVSSEMINALYMVVNQWQIKQFALPWYSLWGKTGTSQIAYKWKYQQWAGWTNGSFAGIITRDNLKYVVVIQIRRPRQSVWWELTAGKIFGDIAKFLIMYEGIDK